MRSLLLLFLLFTRLYSNARTITVAAGTATNSLRKALAIAGNGDTILVSAGTYKDGNTIITKPVTIIGSGRVILDGEKKYEILTISGTGVIVKNIIFNNAGYSALNDYAAIKIIDAKGIWLENNQVNNAYFAIHVSNSSLVTVRNNTITGTPATEQQTGNGIHLWKCNNALIENNHIQGQRDGIYFEFVTCSTIRNNLSEKNIRYGLHFMYSNDDIYQQNTFSNNGAGVAVMYSKKVRMERNHFEQNWGPSAYGLLLKDISDSHINGNTFYKNTVGIHLEGTSRMEIFHNSFNSNGWAVKVQASCEDNNFLRNNFMANSFDVGTNGTMVLNQFNSNYWDKYEGYDLNHDGIGDVVYHPVSLYSMIVEENPYTLMLYRSFAVQLMDKAEKAIPSLTPENLADNTPLMKSLHL